MNAGESRLSLAAGASPPAHSCLRISYRPIGAVTSSACRCTSTTNSSAFVILEMGPPDGNIYEALRLQIGSALKGALLATRNVELYREAVEARTAAEAANGLKSRFLSTVSHELRTPLSLIVGTIEMQLREEADSDTPLPEHYHRDLSNIRTSAQHLARLIGDVLDLASSQAGQLRLARERLRLAEVFARVTTLGEVMAREKGLAWQANSLAICLACGAIVRGFNRSP